MDIRHHERRGVLYPLPSDALCDAPAEFPEDLSDASCDLLLDLLARSLLRFKPMRRFTVVLSLMLLAGCSDLNPTAPTLVVTVETPTPSPDRDPNGIIRQQTPLCSIPGFRRDFPTLCLPQQ